MLDVEDGIAARQLVIQLLLQQGLGVLGLPRSWRFFLLRDSSHPIRTKATFQHEDWTKLTSKEERCLPRDRTVLAPAGLRNAENRWRTHLFSHYVYHPKHTLLRPPGSIHLRGSALKSTLR